VTVSHLAAYATLSGPWHGPSWAGVLQLEWGTAQLRSILQYNCQTSLQQIWSNPQHLRCSNDVSWVDCCTQVNIDVECVFVCSTCYDCHAHACCPTHMYTHMQARHECTPLSHMQACMNREAHMATGWSLHPQVHSMTSGGGGAGAAAVAAAAGAHVKGA
jgi:hypothetical protein